MPFCPRCKYEYVAGLAVCPDCETKLVASLSEGEKTPAQPEFKLVTVHTTSNVMEAATVKSFLESAGIACFVKNAESGGLYPIAPVGEVELQVPAELEEDARLILEDLKQSDKSLPE